MLIILCYMYSLDERSIALIDFKPLHSCFRDIPYKKYVRVLLEFYSKFGAALKVQRPGWQEDVFLWSHTIPDIVPKDTDGHLSGYLVLQYMSAFGNDQRTPICMDAQTMRHNFVIDILSSGLNAYRKRLPPSVQHYLTRITGRSI